jgi:putative transposase
MKRKRFAVEQIVAVLKEAEAGPPVADLIRRIGISEQTFYRWKKHVPIKRGVWTSSPTNLPTGHVFDA